MKTIEQLTAAPSGKVLQELRTLYVHLKQNDYTMDDFLEYMDGLNLQTRKKDQKIKDPQPDHGSKPMKCSECGGMMFLLPVNTGPGDQVEGKYHSQWVCRNPECMNIVFNVSTRREILDRIRDVEVSNKVNKTLIPNSKCPRCGVMRYLYRVNTSAEDQVGGLHKSQWVCPGCEFEEFSPKSNEELMEGLSTQGKRCKE